MKRIFMIGCLLVLMGCVEGDTSIPRLKFDGLSGNVERVRESIYEVEEKFGEAIPIDLEEIVIYDFSADGYLTKQATYDEDGDFLYGIEMVWEDGRCVQSSSNSRWQEGPVVSKFISESNGITIFEEVKNGRTTRYEEENIEKGLTRTTIHRLNGKETTRIVCTYDKHGKMLHQYQYGAGNELEIHNEIDKDGRLVERTIKTPEYTETVRYQYKAFDAKGNWTKAIMIKSGNGEIESGMVLREYNYRN